MPNDFGLALEMTAIIGLLPLNPLFSKVLLQRI
jgi:hypothetical protein